MRVHVTLTSIIMVFAVCSHVFPTRLHENRACNLMHPDAGITRPLSKTFFSVWATFAHVRVRSAIFFGRPRNEKGYMRDRGGGQKSAPRLEPRRQWAGAGAWRGRCPGCKLERLEPGPVFVGRDRNGGGCRGRVRFDFGLASLASHLASVEASGAEHGAAAI